MLDGSGAQILIGCLVGAEMMNECTGMVSVVIKVGLGHVVAPIYEVLPCAQHARSAKVRAEQGCWHGMIFASPMSCEAANWLRADVEGRARV